MFSTALKPLIYETFKKEISFPGKVIYADPSGATSFVASISGLSFACVFGGPKYRDRHGSNQYKNTQKYVGGGREARATTKDKSNGGKNKN